MTSGSGSGPGSNAGPGSSSLDNNPSNLRPLLPAAAGRAQPYRLSPLAARKRRTPVNVACAACRRRKAKCSGGRPKCSGCIARRIECEYDTAAGETHSQAAGRKYEELKGRVSTYERIYDALRYRPAAEVEAILKRIRRGDDPETVTRHIEYGDLLLQIALVPETRYRYEFPLFADMPAYLLRPTNPYLNSMIYEWAWKGTTSDGSTPSSDPSSLSLSDASPSAASNEALSPYLKPYHAAELVDPRLNSVEPAKWTTVCNDNGLMRKLLAVYFLQDHDWWSPFQKDYFLEDMASGRKELCSSLLVNAVLAVSCKYYRGLADRVEFWNTHSLGYRFLAEARRLWEYEQNKNKLTTVQAGMVLNWAYNSNGADILGWSYTLQSCTMAHNLEIFKRPDAVRSERVRNARVYTAWSLFTFQSLVCFAFWRAPVIRQPPEAPLPDPSKSPEWYGETWLKYPLSSTIYPANSGDLFKAKAEFHVILNEAGQRVFDRMTNSQQPTTSEIAGFLTRFRSWYDNLPESLSPRRIVLPGELKLHMHYCRVLLLLLVSLGNVNEKDPQWSAFFELPPSQIISDLKACLETLLRAYYLRHGFESLDSFLTTFLVAHSFMSIEEMPAAQKGGSADLLALRSTLILLVKGLYEQSHSFYLGHIMFRLVASKLGSVDLEALKHYVKIEEDSWEERDQRLKEIRSEWPVSIVSVSDNPEAKRIAVLVEQYRELSMEGSNAGDEL